MRHFATPDFWSAYAALPAHIRRLADSNFRLPNPIRRTPRCTSNGSAVSGPRALDCTTALGVDAPEGVVWFWIGSHADYDKLVGG